MSPGEARVAARRLAVAKRLGLGDRGLDDGGIVRGALRLGIRSPSGGDPLLAGARKQVAFGHDGLVLGSRNSAFEKDEVRPAMVNPSSNFLRGANTGGAEGSAQPPDETAVLMAIGQQRLSVVDISKIASDLMTTPTAVSQIVDQLMLSGLVDVDSEQGGTLRLTDSGQRALRYASVAKF